MDFNEDAWLEQFVRAVTEAFPGRVECIGPQGSRGRGEAGPDSDIDMVVILDELKEDDLERYRRAVIRYQDMDFQDQVMELEGDLSELLQHEYDHLDGILATMRAVDNKSFVMKR